MARLKEGFLGALIALIAQFLLGMTVNLFVTIDPNHPNANPTEYFTGVARNVAWAITSGPSIWLAIHAVFGLLLVLAAINLLVRAVSAGRRGPIIAASVGAFGVVVAGFNGGSFLNYHQDFSSMLMASGFAIAMVSFAVGLFLTPEGGDLPEHAGLVDQRS
ncbi:MAG TPA: hypothetical protein VF137_11565 [Candidatus Dormibacteraeota bacterium]